MAYTVAIRERGKMQAFQYIDQDLRVRDTPENCKPLSREDAAFALRQLVKGAAKAGRPIDARIVTLAEREG